ncbi:MAG: tryptophan--tRNA ligase, partial [Candidatus Rokubacteria bacterium]|nr:tryptophan--tRNA ligase [Candidatus Rokubacteria bacterium]
LNAFLDPIRERRAYYAARPNEVRAALAKGAEAGRRAARETMELVHAGLGMNYLEDVEKRLRE